MTESVQESTSGAQTQIVRGFFDPRPKKDCSMNDWDLIDDAQYSSDEGGEHDGIARHYLEAGEDLFNFGVTVVRCFDETSRLHWNRRLFQAMDEFPEYKIQGRNVQRVLGGFGALGNPASFHHPDVRIFRRIRKKTTFRPVLASFVQRAFSDFSYKDVMLEALFDRLCVRCETFKRPVAEAWHRDIYGAEKWNLRALPRTLPGGTKDILFGGWTNLDHREQKLVCLLSTHSETSSGSLGFSEFSDAEKKENRFNERLWNQRSRRYGYTLHTDDKGFVRVPPGHCVIFQQPLIHSVVSGPQPDTPALRVFHGLRVTKELVPLFDNVSVMENGGVPRIPSGQMPSLFSSNHFQLFSSNETYRQWGEKTFKTCCLFERVSKTGVKYATPGSANNRNRAANAGRYMPSLSEMGLWDDRFLYSEKEKRAMHPQRIFSDD